MKRLLYILCLLIFTSSVVFSATDYKGTKTHHYDMSADIALKQKLENEFDKKYKIDENTYSYPINAHRLEVIAPFDMLKDKTYHYVD